MLQLLVKEYEKKGGGYTTDKDDKDDSQNHLKDWTEEQWQTKEGSGNAKKSDGTQKRYLPQKAWENMSEKAKKETDDLKQHESKKGKQHVANTEKAKESRKQASRTETDEEHQGGSSPRRSTRKRSTPSSEKEDNSKKQKTNSGESSKKQKSESGGKNKDGSYGSKHVNKEQELEGYEQASKDNLPKKGDSVKWVAMPGVCEGKVTDVFTKEKTINGRKHKATEEMPMIAAKSCGPSGKIAVHKADKVYLPVAAH